VREGFSSFIYFRALCESELLPLWRFAYLSDLLHFVHFCIFVPLSLSLSVRKYETIVSPSPTSIQLPFIFFFLFLSFFLPFFLSFFLSCLPASFTSSILYPQVHHHRHQYLSLHPFSLYRALPFISIHSRQTSQYFKLLTRTAIYFIRSASRDAHHRANDCRPIAHTHTTRREVTCNTPTADPCISSEQLQ